MGRVDIGDSVKLGFRRAASDVEEARLWLLKPSRFID